MELHAVFLNRHCTKIWTDFFSLTLTINWKIKNLFYKRCLPGLGLYTAEKAAFLFPPGYSSLNSVCLSRCCCVSHSDKTSGHIKTDVVIDLPGETVAQTEWFTDSCDCSTGCVHITNDLLSSGRRMRKESESGKEKGKNWLMQIHQGKKWRKREQCCNRRPDRKWQTNSNRPPPRLLTPIRPSPVCIVFPCS